MRSSATRENQRYFDVSPKEKSQNQDLGNHQVYIFKINILFLMREVKKQGTENILHICALCLYGPACPTFSVPSFSREKMCLQVHLYAEPNPLIQVLSLGPSLHPFGNADHGYISLCLGQATRSAFSSLQWAVLLCQMQGRKEWRGGGQGEFYDTIIWGLQGL